MAHAYQSGINRRSAASLTRADHDNRQATDRQKGKNTGILLPSEGLKTRRNQAALTQARHKTRHKILVECSSSSKLITAHFYELTFPFRDPNLLVHYFRVKKGAQTNVWVHRVSDYRSNSSCIGEHEASGKRGKRAAVWRKTLDRDTFYCFQSDRQPPASADAYRSKARGQNCRNGALEESGGCRALQTSRKRDNMSARRSR